MTELKSIRINKEVLEKLEIIASEENRSLSNLINKILADFTKNK